jgi:uncharacterized small protein (TIGR04563 family)
MHGFESEGASGRTMARTDKRKQSLYFPEAMLREIQAEANRQDRSLSWVVQKAWQIAKDEVAQYPAVNDDIEGEEAEDDIRGRDSDD